MPTALFIEDLPRHCDEYSRSEGRDVMDSLLTEQPE